MTRSISSIIQCNPIFIASTAVGMFPFRLVGGILELDRILFCYSVVATAFYLIAGVIALKEFGINLSKETVFISLRHVFILYHVLQYPGCLAFILLKQNLLRGTVASFQYLIRLFNKVKFKSNSQTSKLFVFFDALQPFVSIIVLYYVGNLSLARFFLLSFVIMLLISSSLYITQFTFLVGIISELFEAQINILKKSKCTVYRNLDIKMMERLIETAEEIVSVARNINSIYSFQLLFLISSRFLFLLMHMHSIVGYFSSSFSLPIAIISDLFMTTYHFFYIWKISHASELASKKVCKILSINSMKLYIFKDYWNDDGICFD